MLFRRSTLIALQAAISLARMPGATPRPLRDLASEMSIPATYLVKVLQGLTRAGVLKTVRGPGGGVQLARPATELKLWDVLAAIEPMARLDNCFLSFGDCKQDCPCALHEQWMPIRGAILQMLRSNSLAELCQTPREFSTDENG